MCTATAPERLDQLREPFCLELVIDRRPRGEDGPFAVDRGADERGAATDAVEVERFRHGGGRSDRGRERDFARAVVRWEGRKRREGQAGRVAEVRVGAGQLGRM